MPLSKRRDWRNKEVRPLDKKHHEPTWVPKGSALEKVPVCETGTLNHAFDFWSGASYEICIGSD